MAEEINNYIEDDWNDNSLTSRSASEKGYYYNYQDGGTGDLLKGVYRPRWESTGAGGSISSSNGYIQVARDGTSSVTKSASTPSAIIPTEISWELYLTGQSTNKMQSISIITDEEPRENMGNEVSCGFDSADPRALSIAENGVTRNILSTPTVASDTWHTARVTRSTYGEYEVFSNGSSVGTVTDSFTPNPGYIGVKTIHTNATTRADNLLVQ